MKAYELLGLVAFGLTFGIGLACLAGEPMKIPPAVQQIVAGDEKTRVRAGETLLAERAETIRGLLGILEKPTSPSNLWLIGNTPENVAINVLGKMRALEAISMLMKWAEPPKGGFDVLPDVPDFLSPAGKALIEIGKPADPALISVLGQNKDKPFWTICLEILKQIEGPKCGAVVVDEAIAKEADATTKANLQAALKKLKEEK